jgi:uncharacterized protein
VVVGCNFCPFAAKALLKKSIRYVVLPEMPLEKCLEKFIEELHFLDTASDIETTFLIFPDSFVSFRSYLRLVSLAEALVTDQNYDGVYQVASFHPNYTFAGARRNDPANFTNRSIYPMLHILREASVTAAIEHFPDPEGIPARNIAFAQEKGLKYMEVLRAACM